MAERQLGKDEWDLAYRVAMRVLKSPDRAADAAQDAILRAHAGRDRYQVRNFEPWFRRVAYTSALQYLRSAWERRKTGELGEEDHAAEVLAQDDELSGALLSECLDGCLDDMRDGDRVAFTERFLRGATHAELGELMGVSTNTAKQRAFRARRRVRQCIETAGCATDMIIDNTCDLASRTCVPCTGGIQAMQPDEARRFAERLGDHWTLVDDHHLRREYTFHDFAEALAFTQRVGAVAEHEGHHPTIELSWGRVVIESYTHKVDGLTESDFILAAKTDQLYDSE